MVNTRRRTLIATTDEKDTATTAAATATTTTTAASAASKSGTETETDESGTSSGDFDDDSDDEAEFEIDHEILENPRLRTKVDRIIEYITSRSPSMKTILQTPMRLRNKAKIFELIMIYEQTLPMTEERMMLRNQLFRLTKAYKNDLKQFRKHGDTIRSLEKDSRSLSEYSKMQSAIIELDTSRENKLAIYQKFVELQESSEPDSKLRVWLKEALKLPFNNIKVFPSTPPEIIERLIKTREILDQELFGMDNVKEQLLLFLHTKMMNPSAKGCCLGLIGPPGVGKTSIAKCLASAMELPFEQISFGGAQNPDFIKGHDYTYVGSRPGEVARCISRMKYKNGILFLDEYEKISKNKDIVACLLHITDFSQNHEFRDNYFSDLLIDLSSLWFIYSMNELPEDTALADRIMTVNIDGYSDKEKVQIVIHYLFPRHLKNLNLQTTDIIIDSKHAEYLVRKCPNQNRGIRDVERLVKDMLAKISFIVLNKGQIPVSFDLKKQLEYPVTVTENMIDVLTKNSLDKRAAHLSMYM
jgi:ATP-dependent Lon protease